MIAKNELGIVSEVQVPLDPEGYPASRAQDILLRDEFFHVTIPNDPKMNRDETNLTEKCDSNKEIIDGKNRGINDIKLRNPIHLSFVHRCNEECSISNKSKGINDEISQEKGVIFSYKENQFKNYIPPIEKRKFTIGVSVDNIYTEFDNPSTKYTKYFPRAPSGIFPRKSSFRVSNYLRGSFENSKKKTSRNSGTRNNQKTIIVSVWEEFFYGVSMLHNKSGRPSISSISLFVYKLLRETLSLKLIQIFFIMLNFFLFIWSHSIYEDLCKMMGTCMFERHLTLHQMAYDKNIKITFTGNAFQGLVYVYIRQNWCAYCAEEKNGRIASRLLKQYRSECLNSKQRTS